MIPPSRPLHSADYEGALDRRTTYLSELVEEVSLPIVPKWQGPHGPLQHRIPVT